MPADPILSVTHLRWQWDRPCCSWTRMGWTPHSRTDLHPLERPQLSPECRSPLNRKTATNNNTPLMTHPFVIYTPQAAATWTGVERRAGMPFVMTYNSSSRDRMLMMDVLTRLVNHCSPSNSQTASTDGTFTLTHKNARSRTFMGACVSVTHTWTDLSHTGGTTLTYVSVCLFLFI